MALRFEGCATLLLLLTAPSCERNADTRSRDQPMPVGTRTRGEGPNPDTKDESVNPDNEPAGEPKGIAKRGVVRRGVRLDGWRRRPEGRMKTASTVTITSAVPIPMSNQAPVLTCTSSRQP